MKLVNSLTKINLKGIALVLCIFLTALSFANTLSIKENEKVFTEEAVEADKKKKVKKEKVVAKKREELLMPQKYLPSVPNKTVQNTTFHAMNDTFIKQEMHEFKNIHRTWDYKMIDKQIEDIFKTMHTSKPYKTIFDDRAYMEIFLNHFYECDHNADNVLSLAEFKGCMINDTYLAQIKPPPKRYASLVNYTDPNYFYDDLFYTLDNMDTGSINFHAYMELRLMIFSWKKCSVVAPFLEESAWECAIQVVAQAKGFPRTTLRNTFYMALELSNAKWTRNLDFIGFLMFGSGARLFNRINGKVDGDITKNEFNLMLDDNMLPARYNQEIVNQMFVLTQDHDVKSSGLDFQTFIYYDFALRLFSMPNATNLWHLNQPEFAQVLAKPLFPNKIMNEMKHIPMSNYTAAAYQMYTYMNIKNFATEEDYLFKFAEKKSTKLSGNLKKSTLSTRTRTNKQSVVPKQIPYYNLASNVSFFLNFTAGRIFDVIDTNSNGEIDWYDFGTFFQTAFLFQKFDVQGKGKLVAGDVYEKYIDYGDFPRVSSNLKARAKRFNTINQDTYVDMFNVLVALKIDDIVALYVRKTDKSTLYEVELKRIFNKVTFGKVSDGVLNGCLRGLDANNIPMYDWECAFMAGLQVNINYIESAASYNTQVANNLTLTNTAFYNVDPTLLPVAPAFF